MIISYASKVANLISSLHANFVGHICHDSLYHHPFPLYRVYQAPLEYTIRAIATSYPCPFQSAADIHHRSSNSNQEHKHKHNPQLI